MVTERTFSVCKMVVLQPILTLLAVALSLNTGPQNLVKKSFLLKLSNRHGHLELPTAPKCSTGSKPSKKSAAKNVLHSKSYLNKSTSIIKNVFKLLNVKM